MKPIFSYLRSQFGHTCLGYIDDSFHVEDSYLECEEATLHAVQLFGNLGFKIPPENSVVAPTQTLEFLGFILNSILGLVTLTNRKAVKILQLCQTFSVLNKQFTIREVASFLWTLVSSFPGVEFIVTTERNLKLNQWSYDSFMTLSHDSLEVLWWPANIQTASRRILHNSPDVVVYSCTLMHLKQVVVLIDTPCTVKATAQNLIHPTLNGPHPVHHCLELQSQRFHQTLSKSSYIPGETAQKNSIKCLSTSGCNFVVKGHMIHCIPL